MREEHYIKLKEIREEKGFTQSEVASHLGVSRQAISQWERGIAYPDIDNLVLLCHLYQVSLDDLVIVNEEGKDTERHVTTKENLIKNEEKTNESRDLGAVIEFLSILVVLAISSQIAFLGMVVPIILCVWIKKNRKMSRIIYVVSFIGFLICAYNTWNLLSYYMFANYGTSQIETM